MMNGKAIWKPGIGEIAKPFRGIAPEPHKGGFTAPHMTLQLQEANVLMHAGLWPSWKMEVTKSPGDHTWRLLVHHPSIISVLSLNSKKTCGNEIHEKETKPIHPSAADLLHIGIGNINWCKCGHCKNKVREIDCLSCREVWRSYTQELPRTLSFDPKPNPNPHSCNTLF